LASGLFASACPSDRKKDSLPRRAPSQS
jgi:hypothetical protein